MNNIEAYAEKLNRMHPIYYRLDDKTRNIVSEIAKKYPYSAEDVSCIFLTCGSNQEETEKYIMRKMMYGVV